MHARSLLPILAFAFLILAAPASAQPPGAVPGWAQVNSAGFGDARNAVGPLAVFDGALYAGTWSNAANHPVQIWRAADGKRWSQFSPPWSNATESAYDLEVFGGKLYVGVDRNDGVGGEVWRTDGATWEQVVAGGFDNAQNIGINALAVFSDTLYAVTTNATTGPEIWRSASGDNGDWHRVATDSLSQGLAAQDVVLEVLAGQLFLGLGRQQAPTRYLGELWRSADGATWAPVFTDGLGNSNNSIVSALAEFDGDLYLGFRNIDEGGEVWRSPDGANWSRVVAGGLGNRANSRPYGLFVFQNQLYAVFSNTSTGAEVWRLRRGAAAWQPVVSGGWGDRNNGYADYFDKGAAVFDGRLYVGTLNRVTGGEVWLYLDHRLHLPLMMR